MQFSHGYGRGELEITTHEFTRTGGGPLAPIIITVRLSSVAWPPGEVDRFSPLDANSRAIFPVPLLNWLSRPRCFVLPLFSPFRTFLLPHCSISLHLPAVFSQMECTFPWMHAQTKRRRLRRPASNVLRSVRALGVFS